MIQAFLAISCLASFEASPLDLLETGIMLEWSELPFMAGLDARTTVDGRPLLLCGGPGVPLPPWGSFEHVEILSPLEAGIWGGGGWTAEFSTPGIPDSSYGSAVGLLESTAGRNRYSGLLLRPLPLGMGVSAALGREDTISTQLLGLERGSLSATGFLWQGAGGGDGYSAGLSYRRPSLSAGCFLASPVEGERLAEPTAAASASLGRLTLESAAGLSAWDSLTHAEAHLRSSFDAGPATLIARGDMSSDSGETEFAGTAGLLCRIPGGPALGAGFCSIPGGVSGFLATAGWGPAGAEFFLDGSDASAGAHITWPAWLGLSGFVSDSLLRGSVSAFPGFGFGGNGRITIGGRLVALQSDPGDGSGKVESTSADACISLNILGFSLVGALEDAFDDDDRRMSYGVVWVFSDGPPWEPQEEDGRGS